MQATTQTATPEDNDDIQQHDGPDTGPINTVPANSLGGWLSGLFGNWFTPKDGQELAELAKRQRGYKPITAETKIEEIAVNAEMSVSDLIKFLSQSSKEDDEVIDSFNDEKDHPVGVAMHHLWTFVFYLAPPIAAMIVGWSVGQKFGGTPATITLCLLFEAIPIILMFATSRLLSRALGGTRSAWLGVAIIGSFFGVVAIGSALAQWTLFEGTVSANDFAAMAGAVIRTFTLPLAEIVAAVALPVLLKKSLDSHLSVLDKRTDAKTKINQKKIQNQINKINAAMKTKSDLQKEEDYQKKQELATRLIDIITKKILKDAEKSVNDDNQDTGNSYRRDGRR